MRESDPHHLQLTVTSEKETVMTRAFDAPRGLVFEALTDCDYLRRWFGMRGSTLAECALDLRPGGKFRFVERSRGGELHAFIGGYEVVEPPARLVYTFAYDVAGRRDNVTRVSLTLREEEDVTVLTSTAAFASSDDRAAYVEAGMDRAAAEGYDRLAEVLTVITTPAAEDELVLARLLDVRPEVAFAAWTEPERLARWWGPAGFEMVTQEMDLRPGGRYLYGMRPPGGQTMWGTFVYREIQPPERLVYVSAFADERGATVPNPYAPVWPLEVLNTLTFFDAYGRTMLVARGRPHRAAARERAAFALAREDVRQGLDRTFEQLRAYLAQA